MSKLEAVPVTGIEVMANIKKGDLVQVISGRSQARGGDRGISVRAHELGGVADHALLQALSDGQIAGLTTAQIAAFTSLQTPSLTMNRWT